MLKKSLWSVIIILISACSIYLSNGGLLTPVQSSSTPTMTAVVSTTMAATATARPTSTSTATPIPTTVSTATATATSIVVTTAAATATPTKIPSTATATSIPATATPTATSVPMVYSVQTSSPVYIANFAHSTSGCSWQGVAGQVFDTSGNPVKSLVIKVTGTYNSVAVSLLGVTGMVSGNPYGPGSYEIVLGTTALSSTNLLSIQVLDTSGNALSTALKFSTYSDCSKNLAVINFKAN